MQIGHKIYFDKLSGNILVDKGEMEGDVKETTFEEDKLIYSQLTEYTGEIVGILQLEYGDRSDEFINLGSMKIVNGELIIYPRLSITVDKNEILSDGVDMATITVTVQDTINTHDIIFTVNDGNQVIINAIEGAATLQFDTTLQGDYIIKAESDIYGIGSVTIKGV